MKNNNETQYSFVEAIISTLIYQDSNAFNKYMMTKEGTPKFSLDNLDQEIDQIQPARITNSYKLLASFTKWTTVFLIIVLMMGIGLGGMFALPQMQALLYTKSSEDFILPGSGSFFFFFPWFFLAIGLAALITFTIRIIFFKLLPLPLRTFLEIYEILDNQMRHDISVDHRLDFELAFGYILQKINDKSLDLQKLFTHQRNLTVKILLIYVSVLSIPSIVLFDNYIRINSSNIAINSILDIQETQISWKEISSAKFQYNAVEYQDGPSLIPDFSLSTTTGTKITLWDDLSNLDSDRLIGIIKILHSKKIPIQYTNLTQEQLILLRNYLNAEPIKFIELEKTINQI